MSSIEGIFLSGYIHRISMAFLAREYHPLSPTKGPLTYGGKHDYSRVQGNKFRLPFTTLYTTLYGDD